MDGATTQRYALGFARGDAKSTDCIKNACGNNAKSLTLPCRASLNPNQAMRNSGETRVCGEGALSRVLIVSVCTFGQVQLEIPQAKVGLVVGKGTPVKTIWSF